MPLSKQQSEFWVKYVKKASHCALFAVSSFDKNRVMKLFTFLAEKWEAIRKALDWYLSLSEPKRVRLHYLIFCLILLYAAYYNDKRHREFSLDLSRRIDSVNVLRSKELDTYTRNVEKWSESYKDLVDRFMVEKQEPIKSEP